MALSPTDERILISCSDFTARILRLVPGRHPKITLAHPTRVQGVAFSPNGRSVATATWWSDLTDQTARLWNADSGELMHELKGHQAGVIAVTFSPDSQMGRS